MQPEAIEQWMREFRSAGGGLVMLTSWIPDPVPIPDPLRETAVRNFPDRFWPKILDGIERKQPSDFEGQCEGMLNTRPDVVSSIMGLLKPGFVK